MPFFQLMNTHSTRPIHKKSGQLLPLQVAVGLRHAALVTRSGEVYAWGDGAGGKLGLGHAADVPCPQRVHTLWGQPVKHIAAGGAHGDRTCQTTLSVPSHTLLGQQRCQYLMLSVT